MRLNVIRKYSRIIGALMSKNWQFSCLERSNIASMLKTVEVNVFKVSVFSKNVSVSLHY